MITLFPENMPANRVLAKDDRNAQLTYGEAAALGEVWHHALPGRSLVILLCRNEVPHLAAYLGLMAAGHVPVLVSDKIAQDALDGIAQTHDVDALVTIPPGETTPQITVRGGTQGGPLHPELALCLSTSGSTGSPKLVRLSSTALEANARAIADYLDLDEKERPLAHLPFEYSFGLSVVHSHIVAGATLRLTTRSVMEKPFWTALADATSLSGVPFHFEMLTRMRIERAHLPHLRCLTQAGGKLPTDQVLKFHALAEERGWRFHVMYGQTEAGPRIAWLPHEHIPEHPDAIGKPIPGVRLRTEDGELVVNSPSVMLGYAEGRADLARGDEMGGELFTGDMADEPAPGLFRITGRKSRFIKLQGNRVGLSDVEGALARAGHEAWASGRDDLLVLFTTSEPDAVRAAAVAAFSFPPRSIAVRQISTVPRRDTGKVDYGKLQTMADDA
jgi:long-chain acyl-CoA synthetase